MRSSRLLLFLFLVLTGVSSACSEPAGPPPNFGVVVDKGIYRGGQPSTAQIEYLHDLGVRTILKVNDRRLERERATASRLGMKFVNIPMTPETIGNPDTCSSVSQAMAVIEDTSNWPVYVHCTEGRDRTGYLIGVYREHVQTWDWAKVDDELEKYGHKRTMRLAYPQISSELSRGIPACSSELAKPHTTAVR